MKSGGLVLLSKHPKRGMDKVLFLCFCGKKSRAAAGYLISRHTRSCGCLTVRTKGRRYTGDHFAHHGEARRGGKVVEYTTWKGINSRCSPGSGYYERGIRVCKRWKDSYENFLTDVGRRPSNKHSLDRIDNDGNYEPGNVRWATRAVQNRNSRRNHWLTWRGRTLCITDWEKEVGFRFFGRIKAGWPIDIAMTHKPSYTKRTRWWKLEAAKGGVEWVIPSKT